MAKKKSPNGSQQSNNHLQTMRGRLQVYPKPKYQALVVADALNQCLSKSETVEQIIKKHYDSLPPEQITKLQKIFDGMKPSQKKRPYNG